MGLEIDDFGTGYSSISYLRRLPVDRVKVDRTLLTALGSDPAQPALIAAILQLIRACGLEAVWEGVETAEQAEHLRSTGCVSGQGYYFSRPAARSRIHGAPGPAGRLARAIPSVAPSGPSQLAARHSSASMA